MPCVHSLHRARNDWRLQATVFVGNVFAWSEHRGGDWPFNFHLTFYLPTLVGVGAAALTLLVPESCEQQLAEAVPPEEGGATAEMAAVAPVAAPASEPGGGLDAVRASSTHDQEGHESPRTVVTG